MSLPGRPSPPTADVLIVGAGPSGLTAAVLLAMHDVSFRIVDRKATFSENSRAVGIQARSLEVFEQMGIVEAFLARGRKAAGVDIHTEARVRRVDLFGDDTAETLYPFVLLLEQSETERILGERLRSLGHRVAWETEAVGVEDRGRDRVEVTIRTAEGRRETISTRWLVAADGASSFVRDEVGMPFTGGTYEQRFTVADVTSPRGRLASDRVNLNFNDTGFVLLLPLGEPGVHRLASTFPPEAAEADRDPDFDEVRRHVDRVFPGGLALGEEHEWFSTFRIHSRSVDRFRRGRVFFVGDAAHVHSPVGAQGMNTGVQDAHNLAWKLALVCRKILPEESLETYHRERRPVAETLLKTTDRIFRMIDRQGVLARTFRVTLFPALAELVARIAPLRRRLAPAIAQLAIRYPPGPLVPGGDAVASSFPEPGTRFPYPLLSPGGASPGAPGRLDYRRNHLLLFAAAERTVGRAEAVRSRVDEAFGEILATRIVGPSGAAGSRTDDRLTDPPARWRELAPAACLVRPDGHVALWIRSPEPEEVVETVRSYFAVENGGEGADAEEFG